MPTPVLRNGVWPTVGLLVLYTGATRGGCIGSIFPTTLLVHRSAIYPQGLTSKYGLGGRLRFTSGKIFLILNPSRLL